MTSPTLLARLAPTVALLAALACEGGQPPRWDVEPVDLAFDARTTPGDVARANLDAQVTALGAAVDRHAYDGYRASLVPLLLQRAQVAGDVGDVTRASETASTVADPALRGRLIASTLGALHRFDEAVDTLADPDAEAGDTYRLARGDDPAPIVEARTAGAEADPTFDRLVDLAIALTEAGRYDEADQAYRDALGTLRDVSPFPVAFVQFQRGVMWAERAGRPGRALALYREAVARLPSYVVANVHLAELEVELGQAEQAIDRLRPLAEGPDPEPAAFLAELLAGTPEAARHLARATARYETLLSEQRLAYAAHGAEFFLGPGADAERALELALDNLANRSTDGAYELAIEAAEVNGEQALACRLALEVADPRTAGLRDMVARLGASCAD
ncbi:MAG: tetratricopeptide repeat protein [Sandaracinaceae bacterium]